jgi:hypothetical protein
MNGHMTHKHNKQGTKCTIPAVIIFLWLCFFYICFFLFDKISFETDSLALFISALLCALSCFVVLSSLIKTKLSLRKNITIIGLCITVDLGINILIVFFPSWDDRVLLHYYAGINLALMGIAVCGGVLISSIIKKASYIIPLAATAGIADIWSVSYGVTNTIVQSRTAMNFLLFSFPVSGKGFLPIIGMTDYIFAGMFLSLSYNFNIPVQRTRYLIAASFILSISVAVFGGIGVPVLPVMGVSFILGNYNYVRIVDPEEKKEAVHGLLIIIAALALITIIKLIKI